MTLIESLSHRLLIYDLWAVYFSPKDRLFLARGPFIFNNYKDRAANRGESICRLSLWKSVRKSAKTFFLKVFPDFRGESICRLSWKVFADFGGNNFTDFRCESPISISKWNNWLDFRRKFENYFKVKDFSDSTKVCPETHFEILCRLSNQNNLQPFRIFQILNSMVPIDGTGW